MFEFRGHVRHVGGTLPSSWDHTKRTSRRFARIVNRADARGRESLVQVINVHALLDVLAHAAMVFSMLYETGGQLGDALFAAAVDAFQVRVVRAHFSSLETFA